MGGDPKPGYCSGPCDTTAILGPKASHWATYDSPASPAAVYKRGQIVPIRYQRNNHGPGGFIRLSLVPVGSMMLHRAHKENAFHYSCFGAHAIKATRAQLRAKRPFGFTLFGNDGIRGDHAPGYYLTKATIPTCIPDGDYVLGWVWYGGTGGKVSNTYPHPYTPWWKGYFGDYWSCSFVRVEGGAPLSEESEAYFINDMKRYSQDGCMSANNRPGVCSSEPCIVYGDYMKPEPFENGNVPMLKQRQFHQTGNTSSTEFNAPLNNPPLHLHKRPQNILQFKQQRRACMCINLGQKCEQKLANGTGGLCDPFRKHNEQNGKCVQACCKMCRIGRARTTQYCIRHRVRERCKFGSSALHGGKLTRF